MTDQPKPETTPVSRRVQVDFLYLDLKTCDRCIGTDTGLRRAVEIASPVLEEVGIQLDIRKTHVTSETQARALGFVSSPTILVNGRDIAGELRESTCGACSDLCACADGVDCRVWVHRGQEHNEAPAGLILDAIFAEVYGEPRKAPASRSAAEVSANLQRFFAGNKADARSCC